MKEGIHYVLSKLDLVSPMLQILNTAVIESFRLPHTAFYCPNS